MRYQHHSCEATVNPNTTITFQVERRRRRGARGARRSGASWLRRAEQAFITNRWHPTALLRARVPAARWGQGGVVGGVGFDGPRGG